MNRSAGQINRVNCEAVLNRFVVLRYDSFPMNPEKRHSFLIFTMRPKRLFLKYPEKSYKASVTIMADFSPEFNPQFRWRSKHQTKNDC